MGTKTKKKMKFQVFFCVVALLALACLATFSEQQEQQQKRRMVNKRPSWAVGRSVGSEEEAQAQAAADYYPDMMDQQDSKTPNYQLHKRPSWAVGKRRAGRDKYESLLREFPFLAKRIIEFERELLED